MGASLAIVDSKKKIRLLLEFTKDKQDIRERDLLYVGLTKHTWRPVDSNISEFFVLLRLFSLMILVENYIAK